MTDQAADGTSLDRLGAPPLAERDEAAADELRTIEERRDLIASLEPDLDRLG